MSFKVGEKVVCVFAKTTIYVVGDVYDAVKDPVTQLPAIKARDGFLDLPDLVLSKFEPYKEGSKKPAKLELVK